MGTGDPFIDVGAGMARTIQRGPAPTVEVTDTHWLALSGVPGCSDLNMAGIGANGKPDDVDRAVEALRSAELDGIVLIEADDGPLDDRAAALGLTKVGNAPVMGRPAPAPGEGLAVDGVTVRIAGADDIETVVDLVVDAFGFQRDHFAATVPPADGDVDTWMVESDGEPVGTGAFVPDGDVVSIFNMATPPARQRQGHGAAVLWSAMRHYTDAGATRFLLGATEAGYPLYERCGFEVCTAPAVWVEGVSEQFH